MQSAALHRLAAVAGRTQAALYSEIDLELSWSEDELPQVERTKHVHSLHPYLGKFIPQLVEVFLHRYFKPKDCVYDPFVGSGTTLVEANVFGATSIGCDISAFNCLLSRIKTTSYSLGAVELALRGALEEARRDATTVADDDTSEWLTAWFSGRALSELLAYRTALSALELVARIDTNRVTEVDLERYSARWINEGAPLEWRAFIEGAVIANRLARTERLDLACFTALALIRAVWASVHPTAPPPDDSIAQADLGRSMFLGYARQLWERCTDAELDPDAVIAGDEEGVFITYPVRCLRTMELLGLYGLALEQGPERDEVASWVARFLASQPGASHPISDRWGVSLVPPLLLVWSAEPRVVEPYLEEVIRWLCDKHEGEALGLAPAQSQPRTEAEYLLGSALEHIDHPKRRTSYLACIVLDLCSTFELPELYETAWNDFSAVEVTPLVPEPDDDRSQYLVGGPHVNVPMNTSPNYCAIWTSGDGWKMADHHDDDLDRYYLGRLGRTWDALTISLVTRDRHWVALLRALR